MGAKRLANMTIIDFSTTGVHVDDCVSFDNGLDFFGDPDPEIEEIRKKHGEVVEGVEGSPRLILYRTSPGTNVRAKLGYSYTFDGRNSFDEALALFRFTKYCLTRARSLPFVAPCVLMDAHAVCWEDGHDKTLEVEFDACYVNWEKLCDEAKAFQFLLWEPSVSDAAAKEDS